MGVQGADLEMLAALGTQFDRQAQALNNVIRLANGDIAALAPMWSGADSVQFRQRWNAEYRPIMLRAVSALEDASATIERNRAAQEDTSAADGTANGGFNPLEYTDDVFDILRANRVPIAVASLFLNTPPVRLLNQGAVGRFALNTLSLAPGRVGDWAHFATTPAASQTFRTLGIAGALVGTGVGLYDLYQQGNPVDAFQREGAGYVADVASTAFSASTAAFLIAPNPVTAGLVIGTGVVWAGAEVWDRWGDDISAFAGDAWDGATDFAGDAWDLGTDVAGDVWDAAGDGWLLAGDTWDFATDQTMDAAADLAGDAWDAGTDLAGDAWDAGTGVVGDIGGGIASLWGG